MTYHLFLDSEGSHGAGGGVQRKDQCKQVEGFFVKNLVSRVRNSLNNSPVRGARIARRETREYREYLSVEQRSEAGGRARNMSANF